MKIAIQANPSRGKEIISLLESLGGINNRYWTGIGKLYTYYINKNNIIQYDYAPKDYKVYTLEEFEKEFPFKIGDIILIKGINTPNEIIALELYTNKLCYKLDNGLHYAPERLTTYKEMKEERNITLTLDKAKEWYKKGGELKEIALQAFSEKELTVLPKSWEEYCRTYGCVCLSARYTKISTKYDALLKLEQLRDCWRQGWKPKPHESIYTIKFSSRGLRVYYFSSREFLSFPTKEIAEEFLEYFRDLIEQAGDLI